MNPGLCVLCEMLELGSQCLKVTCAANLILLLALPFFPSFYDSLCVLFPATRKEYFLRGQRYVFTAQDLVILILKYCIDQVSLLLLGELAETSEEAELLDGM